MQVPTSSANRDAAVDAPPVDDGVPEGAGVGNDRDLGAGRDDDDDDDDDDEEENAEAKDDEWYQRRTLQWYTAFQAAFASPVTRLAICIWAAAWPLFMYQQQRVAGVATSDVRDTLGDAASRVFSPEIPLHPWYVEEPEGHHRGRSSLADDLDGVRRLATQLFVTLSIAALCGLSVIGVDCTERLHSLLMRPPPPNGTHVGDPRRFVYWTPTATILYRVALTVRDVVAASTLSATGSILWVAYHDVFIAVCAVTLFLIWSSAGMFLATLGNVLAESRPLVEQLSRTRSHLQLVATAPRLTVAESGKLALSPLASANGTCAICWGEFSDDDTDTDTASAVSATAAAADHSNSRGLLADASTGGTDMRRRRTCGRVGRPRPPSTRDQDACLLDCHHPFHRQCIATWYAQGSVTCPICVLASVPLQNFDEHHRPLGVSAAPAIFGASVAAAATKSRSFPKCEPRLL